MTLDETLPVNVRAAPISVQRTRRNSLRSSSLSPRIKAGYWDDGPQCHKSSPFCFEKGEDHILKSC